MSEDEVTEDGIIDLDADIDFTDDDVDLGDEELLGDDVADLEGNAVSVID